MPAPRATRPAADSGAAAGGFGGGAIAQVLWAAPDVTVGGQNLPDSC